MPAVVATSCIVAVATIATTLFVMLPFSAAAAAADAAVLSAAAAVTTPPHSTGGAGAALPDVILAGYANWGQCDHGLVDAARDGMNVLIWFSINLAKDENGAPAVTGPATGQDFTNCVAMIVAEIEAEGLSVVHLVSIGGWNSPHPAGGISGSEFWSAWKAWNEDEVARPEAGWFGFSGFDWDIEGNDDPESPSNIFTMETLQTMGDMSVLGKEEGYIVAMAPAQSYLDYSTSEFSRRVTFAPHEPWQHDFLYHGRNTYAYLLAEYGEETFDFISIQLYEGWSGANWQITENGTLPAQYLEMFVESVLAGWEVDFQDDPNTGLPRSGIDVATTQLVIGLANGWASPQPGSKFLLIWPEDVGSAYRALSERGSKPRGFMFWNIQDEGAVVPGTGRELWLTRELREQLGLNSAY